MNPRFRKFPFSTTVARCFISSLRMISSRSLGNLSMKVTLRTARVFNIHTLDYRLRKLLSLTQPSDPLSKQSLPTIDIAIPCHEKDFRLLGLVIQGALATVRNPIGKITLVTPARWVPELRAKYPWCTILSDESVLNVDITEAINEFVPRHRKGWVVQQILKFLVVLRSEVSATLVVDADTVLVKSRVWLDRSGVQILCVAEEYHPTYKVHQEKVLGLGENLLSFVTHHQLMKKVSVQALFGIDGGGILKWLKEANFEENSCISEYDTYGEWVVTHESNKIVFAKWNNLSIKSNLSSISYMDLSEKYKKFHSVSNHL